MVIPQAEKKVNNLMYQLALRGGAVQNDEGEIVYPYDQLGNARTQPIRPSRALREVWSHFLF